MANRDLDMTLEKYAKEYSKDPEFIAEGLSIKIVEEMLECLERQNLSQSDLAQKMGVSRALISRILNAPSNMTLLTIAKIAVALGMTPDACLCSKSQDTIPIKPYGTVYSQTPPYVGGMNRADVGEYVLSERAHKDSVNEKILTGSAAEA
jgi:transcriptional regulator with XRE-family HTH domain